MLIDKPSTKTTTLALALVTLFASAGCSPVQPKPRCKTQNGDYAARFDVVGDVPAACMGMSLTAELLHVQTYYPDYGSTSATPAIGIEADSAAVAGAVAGATGQEYSFGNYTTNLPDNNNICSAPTMDDTDVMAPAVTDPMTKMTTPATHVVYKWSNVRALTTPASNAIYFGADLTRTQDDCTITYAVSAVNPAVYCGDGVAVDDQGKPMLDDNGNPVADPTKGKPNPDLCDSSPESGTALSPTINYSCDATTLLCIPDAFPGN